MTASTTIDGNDFSLACDTCGQTVTGLGATMHNWDLVWSLFSRHGWTGTRLATGPHSCARCSRVPLASVTSDDGSDQVSNQVAEQASWRAAGRASNQITKQVSNQVAGRVAGAEARETLDEAGLDERVRCRIMRGIPVVELAGDLDLTVADALREALATAGRRPPHLVIDLTQVKLVDSTTLGMLVAGRHRAAQAGGHTCVVGLSPFVRRTLHTLCLLHLFVELPDRDAALAWLRSRPVHQQRHAPVHS